MFQTWTLFLALGCVQGFLVAIVLLTFNGANRNGNRVLAATVAILSFILAEEFFETSGLYRNFPKVLFSTFSLDASFGPLLYLYATSLGVPLRFRKRAIHLLPPVFFTVGFLSFHFITARGAFVWVDPQPTPMFIALVNLKIAYLAVYFFLALRTLSKNTLQSGEPPNNQRLKRAVHVILQVIFICVILIYILFNLNVLFPGELPPSDFFSAWLVTGGIYLLVITALRFPFVFTGINTSDFYVEKIKKDSIRRYQSSSLSTEQKTAYTRQLLAHMNKQKPYHDNQLKIETLAAQLQLPAHHLSQVINEVLEKKFYEFVNF